MIASLFLCVLFGFWLQASDELPLTVIYKNNRCSGFSVNRLAANHFAYLKDQMEDVGALAVRIDSLESRQVNAAHYIATLCDIGSAINKKGQRAKSVVPEKIDVIKLLRFATSLQADEKVKAYIYTHTPKERAVACYEKLKPHFFESKAVENFELENPDVAALFLSVIKKLPVQKKQEEARIWYPKQYTSPGFAEFKKRMKKWAVREQKCDHITQFLATTEARICTALGCGMGDIGHCLQQRDGNGCKRVYLPSSYHQSKYTHLPLLAVLNYNLGNLCYFGGCDHSAIHITMPRCYYDVDARYFDRVMPHALLYLASDMPLPLDGLSNLKRRNFFNELPDITIVHASSKPRIAWIQGHDYMKKRNCERDGALIIWGFFTMLSYFLAESNEKAIWFSGTLAASLVTAYIIRQSKCWFFPGCGASYPEYACRLTVRKRNE